MVIDRRNVRMKGEREGWERLRQGGRREKKSKARRHVIYLGVNREVELRIIRQF